VRLLVYSSSRTVGGAELVLGYLLRELDPGIEVGVLAVDRGVGEAIATQRAATVLATVPAPADGRDVGALRRHARAIRTFDPDILHANHTWPLDCACAELAALLVGGVRVVAVHHLPLESPVPKLRHAAGCALARRIDAHVAVGERAGAIVERYLRLPDGAVRVVPNGVPPPAPATGGSRPGVLSVGAVGRLTDQKHLDALVRALAATSQMHLSLVGDGPERGALERLARDLGVSDRLEITGWIDDARDRLPGLDVLALPSRWEGMPLAILEAMHAGIPVVAADVGSVAEAVADGETGFVVAPGDQPALQERLERLGASPDLRRRLGDAARRVAAARFTTATMARGYEAVYRDVLGGPAADGPG
jgi:glycosyltransferase involved in cell wall biosynthesis